jgi:hypothetical protein
MAPVTGVSTWPGAALKGPAIIAEDETSTIVGANFSEDRQPGYIILRAVNTTAITSC